MYPSLPPTVEYELIRLEKNDQGVEEGEDGDGDGEGEGEGEGKVGGAGGEGEGEGGSNGEDLAEQVARRLDFD